jgi:Bacterial membrane protein YfhO
VSRKPAWLWPGLAAIAATIPFARGITGSQIFYIRDLSLYFWGRYLWLRRSLWSGEWPLWDPYIGAGQSAVSDALHQMFLLPVLLIRLIGSEVLGFNLWILLPFPFAAIGTWLFFRRRFSAIAATLGAIAFAASGPVVSTGNFPNMSWSVAAIPWVLWGADRLASTRTFRNVAILAGATAFQALAGEPVTLFATLVATGFFVLFVFDAPYDVRVSVRRGVWVASGLVLGLMLAAIQLLPMVQASRLAERASQIGTDLWSLHPRALIEAVALHVYGDYYTSPSLSHVPWMPLLNTGREPFFFSLYFGMPLLTLALFGAIATNRRRWSLFWVVAAAAALSGSFGMYTPIYPFLREHLPLLGSFRFPVKYLVVCAMSLAGLAAAGWDAIAAREEAWQAGGSVFKRARLYAAGAALLVGVTAYVVAGACIYFPNPTGMRFLAIATSMNALDPVTAARFMLQSLPRVATSLMLLSLASAVLIFLASSRRSEARAAGYALCLLIVGDLLVHAWGVNPAFDPSYVTEPQWLAYTQAHPEARFYVGGKREGTLDASDIDASRGFLNAPGLIGSASRAALSGQSVFYASAWHGREMLSYDLAVLWPKNFHIAVGEFLRHPRQGRELFLERTGVRYRILPERQAGGRTPIMQIPLFYESYLYDWGEDIAPRVSVVDEVKVVSDYRSQVATMFQPGWDSRTMAILDREPPAAVGQSGTAAAPAARIVTESANRVVVDATAGSNGGYVLLLDSYSPDWRVTVDGQAADIVRADALFRAVRVTPGHHELNFVYRPAAFVWGSVLSAIALLITLALSAWRPTLSANSR